MRGSNGPVGAVPTGRTPSCCQSVWGCVRCGWGEGREGSPGLVIRDVVKAAVGTPALWSPEGIGGHVLAPRGQAWCDGEGGWDVDGSVLRVVVWVLVVGSLIALVGYTWSRMGSYFDRRLSGSEDDVQADIERYGADAPGIRSEVLGPEDRQAVVDARRRRDERDPVSPPTEPAAPVPPAGGGPAAAGPGADPTQTGS